MSLATVMGFIIAGAFLLGFLFGRAHCQAGHVDPVEEGLIDLTARQYEQAYLELVPAEIIHLDNFRPGDAA